MKDTLLWKVFSSYIRLRDSDENGYCKCFTCGRMHNWKKMDAGHGIGRQYNATKYSELNVHAQCRSCNYFGAGEQAKYKEEVERRYGEGTWAKLEIQSRQVCKRGKVEIYTMSAYYKGEVKRIRKEKGI